MTVSIFVQTVIGAQGGSRILQRKIMVCYAAFVLLQINLFRSTDMLLGCIILQMLRCKMLGCITLPNSFFLSCQFWQSVRSLSVLITRRIVQNCTERFISPLADIICPFYLLGDAPNSLLLCRDAKLYQFSVAVCRIFFLGYHSYNFTKLDRAWDGKSRRDIFPLILCNLTCLKMRHTCVLGVGMHNCA